MPSLIFVLSYHEPNMNSKAFNYVRVFKHNIEVTRDDFTEAYY